MNTMVFTMNDMIRVNFFELTSKLSAMKNAMKKLSILRFHTSVWVIILEFLEWNRETQKAVRKLGT